MTNLIYNSLKPYGWSVSDPYIYIPELENMENGLVKFQTKYCIQNWPIVERTIFNEAGSAPKAATFLEHNKAWVVVGDFATSAQSSRSFDTFSWEKVVSGGDNWDTVASGNGHVVANIIGSDPTNKFKESTTGGSWTTRQSSFSESGDCRGIFFSDYYNFFLASYENGRLDFSLNAITWAPRTPPSSWDSNNKYFTNAAGDSDLGIVVAVGPADTFLYTDDLFTFIEYPAPATATWYITYNNFYKIFMAVNTAGGVFISGDGLNWINCEPSFTTPTTFTSLVSFNEYFIATVSGFPGLVYTNSAGKDWYILTFSQYVPSKIFVGNGQLFCFSGDLSFSSVRGYISEAE